MMHTVAGNGEDGFSGDGDLAINAQLRCPIGIAVNESGDIYIADTGNHTIRKISPDGIISTIAGNGKPGFSGDDGLATNAQLNHPYGVAVSGSGEVYIADTENHRIRKISPDGLISTIAGNGKQGFSHDGEGAIYAQLHSPRSIAVSPNGDLYIADTDNHAIRKIAPNGLISTIAGNGEPGFSGDGGLATHAQLYTPSGIAISPSGDLYIADSHNHRIRKISENGLISTIVGNGREGFSGDGGLATNAQLNCPFGVAISESGDLYITDACNDRIRKVALNGLISTIAGNGEEGFSEEAINAQLYRPSGVAVSSSGELYIADMLNHGICKIEGLCLNDPIIRTSLKRYERDHHTSNGLVCFLPLLAKLAPSFYRTILKADTLALNVKEKRMMQLLIDSLMYGAELHLDNLEDGNVVDWLFVLGMVEGSELFGVKTKLLSDFMDALTEDSIPVILERLDNLKERNTAENELLSQMTVYTLERAAHALRSSSTLSTNPIILKYLVQIVPKMCRTEVAPIVLGETNREERKGIESLFNDSAMSDITILLGEKQWYCHRTILSSHSAYFELLFSSGDSFNDLEGGTYRIDCTEFGEELHEVVIKYCYGLLDRSVISSSVIIPLFKCASFYGVSQLADCCAHRVNLITGNYFELVEQLGDYPCQVLCSRFVEFGFANLKPLNITEEKIDSLPEQVQKKLLWKCIQAQVRK